MGPQIKRMIGRVLRDQHVPAVLQRPPCRLLQGVHAGKKESTLQTGSFRGRTRKTRVNCSARHGSARTVRHVRISAGRSRSSGNTSQGGE